MFDWFDCKKCSINNASGRPCTPSYIVRCCTVVYPGHTVGFCVQCFRPNLILTPYIFPPYIENRTVNWTMGLFRVRCEYVRCFWPYLEIPPTTPYNVRQCPGSSCLWNWVVPVSLLLLNGRHQFYKKNLFWKFHINNTIRWEYLKDVWVIHEFYKKFCFENSTSIIVGYCNPQVSW